MTEDKRGRLLVVATPIGNLSDLSERAKETLSAADFIAAEDTRVTKKILFYLGLSKPILSLHRHNEPERAKQLVERMLSGEDCALCSDAGTPAISDPGFLLVRTARESGIRVIPIPGPSALITALSVSGFAGGRFCFEGFLPMNKKTRKSRLLSIADEERTLVFYEAPHKLRSTLRDLAETLGNRPALVARELTKLHEEIIAEDLLTLQKRYEEGEPRGEFVLIVEGKTPQEKVPPDPADVFLLAQKKIADGSTVSDAAKWAAKETGHPKNEWYRKLIGEK